MEPLLQVRNLSVVFDTPEGEVRAVEDLSFDLAAGETLGIVGESGSGKSQAVLALMGLLASNGRAAGRAMFRGEDLLSMPVAKLNRVRGSKLTMIFQDPMTCLNPYLRVRTQMVEVLERHRGMDRATARQRAVQMLDAVKIPDAAGRIDMYPHEFSGGMRQRVMIAMALLCDPDLLVADEPTTALDVTVQAQILDLLRELKRDFNTSIVMITHDLGVVAGLCRNVMVMYAGRCVEYGAIDGIFHDPQHPYTAGLLRSVPRLDRAGETRLLTIPGDPPNLQALPPGCAYNDRCERRTERCLAERPALRELGAGRLAACHHPVMGASQDD
jgi:oligopeptide transport system ATP-binding protein